MRDPVKYCPICDIEKSRFNTHMLCADCESQALLWAAKMARSNVNRVVAEEVTCRMDPAGVHIEPVKKPEPEKTLPCPFCGGRSIEQYVAPIWKETYAMQCKDCGARNGFCEKPSSAFAEWNRRAKP